MIVECVLHAIFLPVPSITKLAPAGWGGASDCGSHRACLWDSGFNTLLHALCLSFLPYSRRLHKVTPEENSPPPAMCHVSVSQQPESCALYPQSPLSPLLFLLLCCSSSYGITATPTHLTTGQFLDVRGHPGHAPSTSQSFGSSRATHLTCHSPGDTGVTLVIIRLCNFIG